ncbi:MAG: hypothetical protein JJE07_08375 [Flavobacteriaceae bacterium]|nr:hypothetical protein [Flavobacteriaceae bacterium]
MDFINSGVVIFFLQKEDNPFTGEMQHFVLSTEENKIALGVKSGPS